MDVIINNLSDPSWWFSACVVAIITSIIGGFIKDFLEKIINKFRKIRSEKSEARALTIKILAENPTYLSLVLKRLILLFMLWIISTLFFLVFPILAHTIPQNDSSSFLPYKNETIQTVIILILGALSSIIGFIVTSKSSLVLEAVREFRIKNNLPKI